MRILVLIVSIFLGSFYASAGNGQGYFGIGYTDLYKAQEETVGSPSRFNIKIQPAIFWATLGLEAEFVASPRISLSLNLLGKLGTIQNGKTSYPVRQDEFLENGYMAELTGRYFIPLSKKKILLAPLGFYVQASVGYSKLLYFDGSTRPFTLHTRQRKEGDPRSPSQFETPFPLIGGVGLGYQIELLPRKVIANLSVATQANSDPSGVFFSFFLSPSIGMMF